jgi:hypothetical protein
MLVNFSFEVDFEPNIASVLKKIYGVLRKNTSQAPNGLGH